MLLIEKLTTDGRTDDGRRRTTDESALEKLRCLSAGGAKKFMTKKVHDKKSYWSVSEIGPYPLPKVDKSALEKFRCHTLVMSWEWKLKWQ